MVKNVMGKSGTEKENKTIMVAVRRKYGINGLKDVKQWKDPKIVWYPACCVNSAF